MKFVGMLAGCIAVLMPWSALAQDPGRDVIGQVRVSAYFGTDGNPAVAGKMAREIPEAEAKRLASHPNLKFEHYRVLGTDTGVLYRSYENWAQPIAGSDEILCRFEMESRISEVAKRLDIELWLSRKKVLKSGLVLTPDRPVLMLGPEWRDGRLIISVELAPPEGKGE